MTTVYLYDEIFGSPILGKDRIRDRRVWNQITIEAIWNNLNDNRRGYYLTGCDHVRGLTDIIIQCQAYDIYRENYWLTCNRCVIERYFRLKENK